MTGYGIPEKDPEEQKRREEEQKKRDLEIEKERTRTEVQRKDVDKINENVKGIKIAVVIIAVILAANFITGCVAYSKVSKFVDAVNSEVSQEDSSYDDDDL